jgi:hypothetical protein
MISVESEAPLSARHNGGCLRDGLERGATGLLNELLVALRESRGRQARRELIRYAHLVEYAQRHPLTFDHSHPSAAEEARRG